MLKGSYIDMLLSGEKRATIRRGIYKPRYEEVIIHAGGRPIAKAKITRVYYKKLKELGEYEARIEGYERVEDLIKELKNVYGDIDEDEYFTILEFEIVQRLDNLPVEDPYMGLSPADIARIALRYLQSELSELDRKILMDLTRTNSIRKTAINIFKSLNKRGIIRRTLKKALRLLVEKGLIKPANPSENRQGETSGG
jgi:hypothetical protein